MQVGGGGGSIGLLARFGFTSGVLPSLRLRYQLLEFLHRLQNHPEAGLGGTDRVTQLVNPQVLVAMMDVAKHP